jgi:hypothetical protein
VPRTITASFPLREPYELNSRGVNLNIKQLSGVLGEGLSRGCCKVLRMFQEHQLNSNQMKAIAGGGRITILKLPPSLSIKVLASSPTGFYQPTCLVSATTMALWCLGGHITLPSPMPLMVFTINIHTIRTVCQLAANIESSN